MGIKREKKILFRTAYWKTALTYILQTIQNFCAVKSFPISVEITAQKFKIGCISDLLKQHCHYQNILNVLSITVLRDIFIHLSRQYATALTFEMRSSSGSKSLFPSFGGIVMEWVNVFTKNKTNKQTKKKTEKRNEHLVAIG